jgi:beta-phosphoglucomutase-like phosphatase (HAD superfamily)
MLSGDWVPAAVVFDCDGLLVDTESCWTVAESELFARRGRDFGPQEKAFVIGRSVPDAAQALSELFDEPGAADAIAAELLGLVEEVVGGSARAMPGALELVELVSRHVPVAVGSNSPRALLDAVLEGCGLGGAFPVSVAADEVATAKPAPDIYLAACLAFEDSMTGLRSAQAAKLRTVGVPTLSHEEFPADVVVGSLTDPGLLAWVGRWGEPR